MAVLITALMSLFIGVAIGAIYDISPMIPALVLFGVAVLTRNAMKHTGIIARVGLSITDTSFAGDVASYMIAKAVVPADTLQKGCIYVEDGIKKKRTIPRIEVSGFMQKYSAVPVSQGNIDVDGRVIEPQRSMMYIEFNPQDFETHWYAEQQSPRLLGRELPVTVENFMVMQLMKRLNEFFENHIWRARVDYDPTGAGVNPVAKGDSGADATTLIFHDGIIKKALDDVNTVQVAGAVALTSTNVVAALDAALLSAPKALLYKYGKGGLRFFLSYPDQQKYETAMRDNTFKNQDTTQQGINRFRGYEIETLAGLPENTFFVVIAKPDIDSNLWYGINSTEDATLELKKRDNASDLFYAKGLFKSDVQIGFTEQLVVYTTMIA